MLDSSLVDYNDLYGASNWKISRVVGGTPGVENWGGVDIVISEIQFNVPSSSQGWGDADFEFIELYNPLEVDIDLSGWTEED